MNNEEREFTENENKGYSRRSILKLLTACGAAVGLDRLMPSSWVTPRVFADDEPAPAAGDKFPIQIRKLSFQWNDSIIRQGQTWCNGSAMFEYFSTVVNVSEDTLLLAVLNSSGPFSEGESISNAGGQVFPADRSLITGNISIPLPGYFPRNQYDGLAVQLREPARPNPYDSNQLLERFIPCNGPLISELDGKACTPKVEEGVLYFTYAVKFKYMDEESAVSETSSLYIAHGDEMLLSDATLGRLGIFPKDPHKGEIALFVDIPEGSEGRLRVILVNNNEDPSNVLYSPRSFVSECPDELNAEISGSKSTLLPNSTQAYGVLFLYNDSAGLLSNQSLLTARLANGPLIYNAVPISTANGYILIDEIYQTIINGGRPCPDDIAINSTYGSGYFEVSLPEVTRMAIQADEDLGWFLGDPNNARTSNTEITILANPTAISLQDVQVEPKTAGLVGATAAAAALGAATWAATRKKDEEEAASDTSN